MSQTAPPRAFADVGQHGDGKTLACKVFHRGRPVPAPANLHQISEVLKEGDTLVWLDVIDPGPNDLSLIQEEFGLHPLSIEDAVQAHQRPKLETYDSYYFVIVQATTLQGTRIVFHEIAIFAGGNFLVTVRHSPPYPLSEIEERWHAHAERMAGGSGFLLYTILDAVVDGYIPVAEAFQERMDALEESLFRARRKQDDVLETIFAMKKDGQLFRRAALPIRDILNPLIRRDLDLFPEDEIAYYRDVYDHAVRVMDQLDALRDLVNTALEIHLSVIANRQNEVAKQLTIIATIFLPLSFLTGFFGQNFSFLINNITGPGPFFLVGLGSELLALSIMLWYFRRKGWF